MKKMTAILGLVLMSSTVFANELDCAKKIYEKQKALNVEIFDAEGVIDNPMAPEGQKMSAVTKLIGATGEKNSLSVARQLNMRTGYREIDQICFGE